MTLKRRICVITGSRAEYGHLFWLMKSLSADPKVQLQVVVTGMHLSATFGLTYKVILKDGFHIDAKVPILNYGNTQQGIAKAIGKGCGSFADCLTRLKPDMVVICGDRYEMLAAAIAAHVMGIPIAHLHGGETSQGAIDEAFRHSITKMSSVHFAATEQYRQRIIQLGENPKHVFNFGAPGLDHLWHQQLLNRHQLSETLHFDLSGQVAIATFHPVTLEQSAPTEQVRELLKALEKTSLKVIFTKANADAGGEIINRLIETFCRKNPKRYHLTDNLGTQRYLSCLKHLDMMIGNSSSGIVESASFQLPVINIGDRQKGRLKAANVLDVPPRCQDIYRAIQQASSVSFKKSLARLRNPYVRFKSGDISQRIKDVIVTWPLDSELLKKSFYDIAFRPGRI